MILGFLFLIQTFLKHCKALSTEKNKRYINILLLLLLLLLLLSVTIKYKCIFIDVSFFCRNKTVYLSFIYYCGYQLRFISLNTQAISFLWSFAVVSIKLQEAALDVKPGSLPIKAESRVYGKISYFFSTTLYFRLWSGVNLA